MMQQASKSRNSSELLPELQSMERNRPQEFLGHLENFCQETLSKITWKVMYQSIVQIQYKSNFRVMYIHAAVNQPSHLNLRCPAMGRGIKRKTWDFARIKVVNQSGNRTETFSKMRPLAKPDFLEWFTCKAPSYRSYLATLGMLLLPLIILPLLNALNRSSNKFVALASVLKMHI